MNDNTNTEVKNNVIHQTAGKLARAIIVDNNGERTAHITFKSGKKLHVATDRINLRAMKAKSAAEAVDKVAHGTGKISLYQVTEVSGNAALTRAYSSSYNGRETGYGIMLKKGKKALTFALSRVDLAKMKAKTAVDALRTAAFTGSIALAPRKNHTAQA